MAVSLYEPRTLMAAAKQIMPINTFLRDTFFGNIKTFVTESFDIEYKKGRRKMAPFVSPRRGGKVVEREGYVTKNYKPPLVAPMRPITVDDIKNKMLGENVYTTRTPDERAKELLAEDMIELDDMITRLEEWMCAQVMFTGQVHMLGEDVDQVLDYQLENKVVLAGTDKWSDPASDPIADLEDWQEQIMKKSGLNADIVVMSADVVRVFKSHPKVQKEMDTTRIKTGQIEPRKLSDAVTYVGEITELGLDIYSYKEWYLDDVTDPENPVEKPMVPEGTVCVATTRVQSSIYYGAVTLLNQKTDEFVTYEGTRIPDAWSQKNPAGRFLQYNSRPLPVPHNVESWYVAKVL